MLRDDEPLHPYLVADDAEDALEAGAGLVVLGDGAAHDDAPVRADVIEGRLQRLSAHVLEVDVDALGAVPGNGRVHARHRSVVERSVEPEFIPEPRDLLVGAGRAHHAAADDPADLRGDGTHGSRRS